MAATGGAVSSNLYAHRSSSERGWRVRRRRGKVAGGSTPAGITRYGFTRPPGQFWSEEGVDAIAGGADEPQPSISGAEGSSEEFTPEQMRELTNAQLEAQIKELRRQVRGGERTSGDTFALANAIRHELATRACGSSTIWSKKSDDGRTVEVQANGRVWLGGEQAANEVVVTRLPKGQKRGNITHYIPGVPPIDLTDAEQQDLQDTLANERSRKEAATRRKAELEESLSYAYPTPIEKVTG